MTPDDAHYDEAEHTTTVEAGTPHPRDAGADHWFRARCSCGWTGNRHSSRQSIEPYRAASIEAREHVGQEHAFTFTHSGTYSRVVCSCGWTGEWYVTARRDIQRALHSDENAHFWAIKRAREAMP